MNSLRLCSFETCSELGEAGGIHPPKDVCCPPGSFIVKSHHYDHGTLANSALGWRQRWAVCSILVIHLDLRAPLWWNKKRGRNNHDKNDYIH